MKRYLVALALLVAAALLAVNLGANAGKHIAAHHARGAAQY